jgi:phospholipase C
VGRYKRDAARVAAAQEVNLQKLIASSLSALIAFGTLPNQAFGTSSPSSETVTPIKHVVVIFGENISFDHYFGTYPFAANPSGEPKFSAKHGSPSVNGYTDALLYNNPNLFNAGNAAGAMNPFRLDRTQAATADQDHNYTPEQEALHFGLMDAFPEYTGTAGPPPVGVPNKGLVMGYYDGNTVTALWNYAQQYAMNDNSFDTNFGPSTPGAINLVSGQTNNVTDQSNATADVVEDGGAGYTLIGDADPVGDVCSTTTGALVQFTGNNIGTMLNAAGISWGFFSGGFDLTQTNPNLTTGCLRSTTSAVTGVLKADYIPHHQPFQYYTTTANPTHARPTSVATIGLSGDAANHQYDIDDFYAAIKAGHMPAVSFLKAPGYQDAHAGYSDPLDEQAFVVSVIDFLMSTKEWESTAVIINYDDSDGWYDHQMPTIVNQSTTASDAVSGPGQCGAGTLSALAGPSGTAHAQGRCAYGPRMPYLVISPYAKENYVSHVMTDQTSTIRFIEDNWLGGERIGDGSFDAIAGRINDMFDFSHPQSTKLVLNEATGEPK